MLGYNPTYNYNSAAASIRGMCSVHPITAA